MTILILVREPIAFGWAPLVTPGMTLSQVVFTGPGNYPCKVGGAEMFI